MQSNTHAPTYHIGTGLPFKIPQEMQVSFKEFDVHNVTAGMATTGTRKSVYRSALSISKQVRKLFIYDNSNGGVEKRFLPKNVTVVYDEALGDIGDLGKFHVIRNQPGMLLTVDDDIFYPGDYVERLMYAWTEGLIVGVHGTVFNLPITHFYTKNRYVIKFDSWLNEKTEPDVLGSGTTLFDDQLVANLDISAHLKYKNAADLLLKELSLKHERQMLLVPRQAQWLTDIGDTQATIYSDSVNTKKLRLTQDTCKLASSQIYCKTTSPKLENPWQHSICACFRFWRFLIHSIISMI